MAIAVELRNVSKAFGAWQDHRYSIKTLLTELPRLRINIPKARKVPVLENINLQINQGDFVGIMGRNGAGKSTLLKLISRIYPPTSGEVLLHGRVAPLLELGAGFAEELTGFENIFLNASILGFNRAEIHMKLQSIMDFSELGQDLHKQVRNYSSGMLVRLGFAIAAHLDTQILLFDEVLAVGDIGFQAKCLKKIRELHASGKTIILVTHDPQQVGEFCSRCVVFDRHGVVYDGGPTGGIEVYRQGFNT